MIEMKWKNPKNGIAWLSNKSYRCCYRCRLL